MLTAVLAVLLVIAIILLFRRGGNPFERVYADPLHATHRYVVQVHGESFHDRELEAVCGGRTRDGVDLRKIARLRLEDSNPEDHNAVRVEIDGKHVGYLSREDAPLFRSAYADQIAAGRIVECRARIRGGWDRGGGDRGNFGVRLSLPLKHRLG